MFNFNLNLCVPILVVLFLHDVQYSAGIIGGSDAEFGEFPYMVSLRNETNKHYCGGSLVSRRHIVTAAHCMFTDRSALYFELEEMYNLSVIKVVIGSVYSEWLDGEYYKVKKLLPHPEYNGTNHFSIYHDIGIVELLREITNDRIIPIALPNQLVTPRKLATVIGWGIDNRDNINKTIKIARVLQKADMTVMEPNACVNVYLGEIPELAFTIEAIFTRNAFCCVDQHVNTCYRDSGSPLIQDGELAGTVIFGNACKEGSPDIFTSTFRYIQFIQDCMQDRCPVVGYLKPTVQSASPSMGLSDVSNHFILMLLFILSFLAT